MFDLLPIAIPAILVVVAAAVLVRRERSDHVVDLTEWDDVGVVPVVETALVRSDRRAPTGGALIEPGGSSLGARIRETAQDDPRSHGRVRIRRRDQPLIASRAEH